MISEKELEKNQEASIAKFIASPAGQLVSKECSELALRTIWNSGYGAGVSAGLAPVLDVLTRSLKAETDSDFKSPFHLD